MDVLVCHELGHCNAEHHKGLLSRRDIEFGADRFAVAQVLADFSQEIELFFTAVFCLFSLAPPSGRSYPTNAERLTKIIENVESHRDDPNWRGSGGSTRKRFSPPLAGFAESTARPAAIGFLLRERQLRERYSQSDTTFSLSTSTDRRHPRGSRKKCGLHNRCKRQPCDSSTVVRKMSHSVASPPEA